MNNNIKNSDLHQQHQQVFAEFLNLSAQQQGDGQSNTFDINSHNTEGNINNNNSTNVYPHNQSNHNSNDNIGTPSSYSSLGFGPQLAPQQKFNQLHGILFEGDSPQSQLNSPVEMFTNLNNPNMSNTFLPSLHPSPQGQLMNDALFQQMMNLQPGFISHQQPSQPPTPPMPHFTSHNSGSTNNSNQNTQNTNFSPQLYMPPPPAPVQEHPPGLPFSEMDASVPYLNFDSPSTDVLVPNSNNFYSNPAQNNSVSNLTVISNNSYASLSQYPPSSSLNNSQHSRLPQQQQQQQQPLLDLLSPYDSSLYVSMSPSHSQTSSRPNSPFVSTSPYSNDMGRTDDDNLSIYQTIENLNIEGFNEDVKLQLTNHEKLLIEREFVEQESKLKVPEIVHLNADKLTEDNLNNNNNMLQQPSTPITINIQAPEDIALKTPSLFSQSNSQRSSPLNSPRNRSRSSSIERNSHQQSQQPLGDSLVPTFSIHDSSSSKGSVKKDKLSDSFDSENNEDDNLLKPSDSDFKRMRQGRRLSNASRSRSRSNSRSRSKSADSRKSDYSDPTKNQEKMIELLVPHSNKRVQKHPSVHACHLCDKTFTRPYNLKSHLRTHTDERPFICGTCGKLFARHHDKKRHEDLHTGERRFQCRGFLYDGVTQWGCGKRFARADALGRHFKTESGKECVRPLLEDDYRRKSIVNGIEPENITVPNITDDMLNNFDFNEILETKMKEGNVESM